jgi:crotonobetaine/carnitine-CoA ligase
MDLHLDPRMPPVDHCVLRHILERRAVETPDRVFAVFEDGTLWTYADTRRVAARTANALRALGVARGDKVVSWLPNGSDAIRIWFGLNYLGAVYVPLNLAYRGRLLEHAVNISKAKLAIAHADLAPRLGEINPGEIRTCVALGGTPSPIRGLIVHPATVLDSTENSPPLLDLPIAPWETQSIIYTSGTTGPSKGVLSSYLHLYWMAWSAIHLDSSDRYMINLPLFHVGGTMPITAMLVHGGSISVVDSFKTEAFWPRVRATGITTTILLGVMANFLLKQPERPDDKNHTLRTVTYVPYNDSAYAFHSRFGSDLYTHFNMTEISMPIVSEANPKALGVAGKARAGATLRVVDENDCEVPTGGVGELVVRTDSPWAMNSGYAENPEATARAWRNGWFHTGDAFRRNEEGEFFFVDRMKDAIRRRGENISSFEVESEVLAHPLVRESAAVAVAGEAEDEVMVVLALRDGASLDPVELIEFLKPRMPHYMVPRYVRIVEALPRTPTAKIEKHVLRSQGLTPDVWDREKAGIIIKRDKLGKITA